MQMKELLIDEGIERAVSRMQTVIELARVIRDRKTMPTKYPLPEVVVIHKDQSYLNDVISLERYVTEELNVRHVTMSSDKDKYGVCLRAEPDHVILGKRLKGDFKKVSAAIKSLTNQQIEDFVKSGEIELEGHVLTSGDIRLIFQFSQDSSRYEAHSDNDVLVLLDVTPDQSMLDEGVAREIVNRVQKLRKKAGLVPTDDVTVFYRVTGADPYLERVAQQHSEYISSSVKSPLRPYPVPFCDVIMQGATQLKGSQLEITLVKGSPDASGGPCCKFVNVYLTSNRQFVGPAASVLLENPKNNPTMRTTHDLRHFIMKLFQVPCSNSKNNFILSEVRDGNVCTLDLTSDPLSLSGSTLFMDIGQSHLPPSSHNPTSDISCRFVNMKLARGESRGGADVGTLLLENPVGFNPADVQLAVEQCKNIFGRSDKKVTLSKSSDLTSELGSLADLNSGDVVYVGLDN